MTNVSTPLLLTPTPQEKQEQQVTNLPDFAEPSNTCISTILNFSKNLEVKQSALFNDTIDLIKS